MSEEGQITSGKQPPPRTGGGEQMECYTTMKKDESRPRGQIAHTRDVDRKKSDAKQTLLDSTYVKLDKSKLR